MRKAWYKDLPENQVAVEMLYLDQAVYRMALGILPMDRFDATARYSKRV